MSQSLSQICPTEAQETVSRAYREGYSAGIASLKEEQPHTLINVNMNSGHSSSRDNRAYFCEVKAFTKTFSAYGSTKLEATQAATKICTSEYNEMHCDDIECKRNK